MIRASDLCSRLNRARELGEGRWVAQCPVHQGGDNLYVTDGDKGTLFFCHAGCKKEEILQAIGLTWRDLFTGKAPRKIYDPSGDAMTLLIYRADVALGKNISSSDMRWVNAAGARLGLNGYILNRRGKLKKRVRETNQLASQHPRNF